MREVNSMREDDAGSSGGEGNARYGGGFGEPGAEGKASPQRTPQTSVLYQSLQLRTHSVFLTAFSVSSAIC